MSVGGKMEISKVMIDNDRYELLVHNGEQHFSMHFGGADFYWSLEDYYEENEFVISKEDKELFSLLRNLFGEIKKHDDKFRPLLKNNTFEWISEAREPEISNKLVIVHEEEKFTIRFVQNPNDTWGAGMCLISFCMSGSWQNQTIAHAFSSMFIGYRDKLAIDRNKIKIKKTC